MQGNGKVVSHWAALCAAPAVLAVAPSSMMLSLHLLQKAATSGTLLAQYGSDLVAAAVIGLVLMGCCGYLLPLLGTSQRRHLKVRLPVPCIAIDGAAGSMGKTFMPGIHGLLRLSAALLATSRLKHLKIWLPALCIVNFCAALP
jgi:hypothetical protein